MCTQHPKAGRNTQHIQNQLGKKTLHKGKTERPNSIPVIWKLLIGPEVQLANLLLFIKLKVNCSITKCTKKQLN